jgi:hypothetical protein
MAGYVIDETNEMGWDLAGGMTRIGCLCPVRSVAPTQPGARSMV